MLAHSPILLPTMRPETLSRNCPVACEVKSEKIIQQEPRKISSRHGHNQQEKNIAHVYKRLQ